MSNHGFNIILNTSHCAELDELIKSASKIQDLLLQNYKYITDNYDNHIYKIIDSGAKQGDFRDELTHVTGKLYDTWDISGSKNRLWRMITSYTYQQYASRITRKKIIEIITAGNYTNICPELWDDLKKEKIATSIGNLKNIFRNIEKDISKEHKISPVLLDYTTGDNSNIRQKVCGDTVYIQLQCGSHHWYYINYKIPQHLNPELIQKITKPVLHVTNDKQLHLRFCVMMRNREICLSEDNILGYDAGKIKPVTCSSVNKNGNYSRELTSSKELDRLNDKLHRLYTNKISLYNKKSHIEKLLKNNEDEDLFNKWELLENEYTQVKSKITKIKSHKSWLIARDVTIHALRENCKYINAEQLNWLDSKGGKWDHSITQQRLEHKSEQYDIRINKVDAHGTSWEYPIEYDINPAPHANYNKHTRELSVPGHNPIDKDYSASIAIAARTTKKKNKKNSSRKREIQPKRCRDKNYTTPQRPKRKIIKDIDHDTIKRCINNKKDKTYPQDLSQSASVFVSTVVDDSQAVSNGIVSINDT